MVLWPPGCLFLLPLPSPWLLSSSAVHLLRRWFMEAEGETGCFLKHHPPTKVGQDSAGGEGGDGGGECTQGQVGTQGVRPGGFSWLQEGPPLEH